MTIDKTSISSQNMKMEDKNNRNFNSKYFLDSHQSHSKTEISQYFFRFKKCDNDSERKNITFALRIWAQSAISDFSDGILNEMSSFISLASKYDSNLDQLFHAIQVCFFGYFLQHFFVYSFVPIFTLGIINRDFCAESM
jgi:hypothetical protein